MTQKILLRNLNRPKKHKIKDEVLWICNSLSLVSGRDVEKTSFKIVYSILKIFSKKRLVSTKNISDILRIESATINHHIRELIKCGILTREKRKVTLRGGSLSSAIRRIQQDSDKIFERLLEISKKIDKKFKLQ